MIGGTELQQLFEQSGTWYMFGPEGTDSAHKVWMTLFWAVACSPPLLFRGMSDLGWVSVWGGMASVIVGLIVVVSVSTVGAPAGADTSIVMVPESFSSALVAIGAIATSYGAANQVPSLTGETPSTSSAAWENGSSSFNKNTRILILTWISSLVSRFGATHTSTPSSPLPGPVSHTTNTI